MKQCIKAILCTRVWKAVHFYTNTMIYNYISHKIVWHTERRKRERNGENRFLRRIIEITHFSGETLFSRETLFSAETFSRGSHFFRVIHKGDGEPGRQHSLEPLENPGDKQCRNYFDWPALWLHIVYIVACHIWNQGERIARRFTIIFYGIIRREKIKKETCGGQLDVARIFGVVIVELYRVAGNDMSLYIPLYKSWKMQ